MRRSVNARRHRFAPACWRIAMAAAVVAIGSAGPAAHAAGYDESVSGDLSSDARNPTGIGALSLGNNYVAGSTIPSGAIVDPRTGERAIQDNDYLTFTVPTGQVLSQILLGADSVFQPGDRMFFGIAQGSQVNVDPSFSSARGLLGWTLVGAPMVGGNVLPDLGRAAPASFPAIGGATGFTGSLGAGSYSLWLVDGDQPAIYSLNLVTSAVPEAATWATMVLGVGLAGSALRRGARRRPVLAT